ncbi:MAG: hypothetical protein ACYC8T_36515 [Myxococcaceae bacterium]
MGAWIRVGLGVAMAALLGFSACEPEPEPDVAVGGPPLVGNAEGPRAAPPQSNQSTGNPADAGQQPPPN